MTQDGNKAGAMTDREELQRDKAFDAYMPVQITNAAKAGLTLERLRIIRNGFNAGWQARGEQIAELEALRQERDEALKMLGDVSRAQGEEWLRVQAAERKLTEATKELREALRELINSAEYQHGVTHEISTRNLEKAESVLAKYPEESESVAKDKAEKESHDG